MLFRRANPMVPVASFALLVSASAAQAGLLTNGSLDGPTNTFSLVPEGWANLVQGTTDTVSVAGHPFAGFGNIAAQPYPASPNGGTFCWSADFFESNAALPEGLRQTVSGFTIGATYEIAFEYTNLGLYSAQGNILTDAFNAQNYASSGRWLVGVDDTQVGATDAVNFAPRTGAQVWTTYAVSFVASATSHELRFTADWVSGGTHVGMGIDGITLTLVPAPTAAGVLALGGALGLRRRRGA
ncbi:MAG: hypothetical protein ACKVZJ_04875 [Phycisphaerales bacterium]